MTMSMVRRPAPSAFLLAVAAFFIKPSTVEACTCVGPIKTCEVLTAAASVFEATVESIRVVASSTPDALAAGAASFSTFSNQARLVTLRDVRAQRGTASNSVITAADSASCGYDFQVGTRYLIVADRTTGGNLAVSRCGLTRPVSEAVGLIDYLRLPGATGPRPPIRVWGRIVRATQWIDFMREYTGVPDAQVTLEGPARRSILTGPDGRFVIENLPPGAYRATISTPPAMPLGQVKPWNFEVGTTPDSACLELAFVAPIESSISGIVIDERGQPLGGVFITLRFPDQRDHSRGTAGAGFTTDAQGRYDFRDLPPGRYAIGVHESRDPSASTVTSIRLGERLVLKPLIVRRMPSD